LKNKFTILGCGSSLGTPWITGNWGSCSKKNKKNIRTRCAAHIRYNNLSILIDTSPDIKDQFLKNKISSVDAIIYTHEHADQTSGIFELRPYYWINQKKIPVFGSSRTIKELEDKYTYCFKQRHGYKPIMKSYIVKNNFKITKETEVLKIKSFDIVHGMINATGYVFKKIAYLSDCNEIPNKSIKHLKNLNYLIIDCLRVKKHPSHFNLQEALRLVKIVKPKKTILTNLHVDFDYNKIKKQLPKNVFPAYDGMNFNF
jgi:phosphoribosyl 1,2-cyclic phosphate phosphodiesterase